MAGVVYDRRPGHFHTLEDSVRTIWGREYVYGYFESKVRCH